MLSLISWYFLYNYSTQHFHGHTKDKNSKVLWEKHFFPTNSITATKPNTMQLLKKTQLSIYAWMYDWNVLSWKWNVESFEQGTPIFKDSNTSMYVCMHY